MIEFGINFFLAYAKENITDFGCELTVIERET